MNRAKGVTAESVWREYEKMLAYNESIQLDDTVRVNENFFVGKQWEGVESNGLPTPVFNFLKRVTLFTVASITSDRIKLLASPVDSSSGDGRVVRAVDVVNAEFDALFEHNRLPTLIHEYLRNAAVDGVHVLGRRGSGLGRRLGRRGDGDSAEHARGLRQLRGQARPEPAVHTHQAPRTDRAAEKARQGARLPGVGGHQAGHRRAAGGRLQGYRRQDHRHTPAVEGRGHAHGLGGGVRAGDHGARAVGPGSDALPGDLAVLGLRPGQLSRSGHAHGADTEPDIHKQAVRHDDDLADDHGVSQGGLRPHARAQVGQRHRPGDRRQRRGRERRRFRRRSRSSSR